MTSRCGDGNAMMTSIWMSAEIVMIAAHRNEGRKSWRPRSSEGDRAKNWNCRKALRIAIRWLRIAFVMSEMEEDEGSFGVRVRKRL